MASARRSPREFSGSAMKSRDRAIGPKRVVTNGAGTRNDHPPGKSLRTPHFRYPKTDLEQAIQRYVELFEFAPIGYVTFDRFGRIEEINFTATRLVGRSRKQLIGSTFAVCVVKEDTRLFLHHLLECRSSESLVVTELRLQRPSGEKLIVQLSSTPTFALMKDGARLYQTAIIDLTERKRFEEKIQRSEERYRTLFDLVPVAVYVCDVDGTIQQYNRRAVELWGREPGRDGKQPKFCGSYKLYYPDGRPMPLEHCPIARALRGEKLTPKDLEIVVERPDGERRDVISAPQILKDGRGKIIGAINSLFDITEQKHAEAAVMRLAAVVRSSRDAVVAKDLNGIISDWNQSAERIFGYKPKEIIGKSILTLIPRERHSEESEILNRIRGGESIDHYETVRRRKDGRLIDVSLTISPIKDVEGKIVGVSKIARDITQRKVEERQLTEQARLLDLSSDAILVRDMFDRVVYWNHGAKEIYGYSGEEAMGKVTPKLLRTEYSEPRKNIFRKLHRDNRWSGELVHTRKDGIKITVNSRWALDRDTDGKPVFILETNNDITEEKRAQEKIRESEAQMRAIVEQATAGMARADREGHISFVNRRFCEIVGYDESEILGRDTSHFTHPDDIRKTHKLFRELIANAKPFQLEKRYLRKDGSIVWVSVSVSPVRAMDGKVQSAVSIVVDITARKVAETELQRSKEMLEQLVQQRTKALRAANAKLKNEIEQRKGLEGEILAISDREQQRLGQELHDGLCQYLTAVAFMARSVALRLKNHRVIDAADIDKIAQLVNDAATDTRDLSRALHRVDVDSAGLVTALQDLVDREIWKTPCRLEVKPSFRLDDDVAAAQLYCVARELVINANKHAQAQEIVVKLEHSRRETVLRVIDDGVGFSNEHRPQQGLGFHIMRYRAQSIGGRLEIDSPKRGGTCVSCYLPDGAVQTSKPHKKERAEPERIPSKITKALAMLI
jgi:PAS domain S-box-containing protein